MQKLILLFFILTALAVKSQDFEYNVLFEGIGDNREYFNDIAYPQTILGVRGAFETGVKFDNHRLRGGLSMLQEFGSDINSQKPKLIMYYQFKNEQTEFLFGAFPRKDKINFPLAMLTDTLLYYRPDIEGMYGKINWKWGYQNGFIDWISRQTDTNSEIFTSGSSGEIFYKNLFIENYILMTHVAQTAIRVPGVSVKDYLGFVLQGGIRTGKQSKIQGYAKAGILESSYRNRYLSDGYDNNISFFAEAKGRYKNFGIKSVLSSGAGHNFTYGDHFYRAENYLRTDVIWYFINHEKVKGSFNLSFHVIDWKDIDQQQQLSILYQFGK